MKAYRSQLVVAVMTVGLIAAACGSSGGSDEVPDSTMADGTDMEVSDSTMADGMDMESEGDIVYPFGSPMDGGEADQVIEITAMDDFSFSPNSVVVESDQIVTFRVTNGGVISHEFTLGTAEMQEEHEAEMAEMSGNMEMHDEPDGFLLKPGETKEMTWHFKESEPIIFGCHQPDHYAAGMKGSVVINS